MRAPLLRCLICASLISASAVTPRTGWAAPPDREEAAGDGGVAAPEDDAPDSDMARAKELFDAGVARYTAADYEGAVDLWLESYALIPPVFENRLIKAELIYNVARAQQKWFDIDQDIRHLRQSHEILGRYLDEIDELYPKEQAALERDKIQEQIDELEQQIAEWEAEQARREAELAERMRPKFDEEADARDERRNKAMLGAGAGLTAIGLGGVGMLAVGIAFAGGADDSIGDYPLEDDILEREKVIDRGRAGSAMIVVGSLAGGVFLAAGVPLLIAGVVSEKRRKQRRVDAGLEARLEGVAPIWLPGGAGLGVRARF